MHNSCLAYYFFVEKLFICSFFLIKQGLGPWEPPAQKNIECCQTLKVNVKNKKSRSKVLPKFVEISNL